MLSEGNAATVQAFLDKRYPRTAVLTSPTNNKQGRCCWPGRRDPGRLMFERLGVQLMPSFFGGSPRHRRGRLHSANLAGERTRLNRAAAALRLGHANSS